MIYKYFIPFCRLSFYFRDSVAQKFKSWWSLFYLLLLLLLSLLLLLNALICWHQKNHCKSQRHEDWLLCLLLSFIVLALLLWVLIHYELFFFSVWCEVGVQLHSFACGYPVLSAPFVEETVISPLNGLAHIFFFAQFNESMLSPRGPVGLCLGAGASALDYSLPSFLI